jgi:hypothetical protein
MYILIWGIFSIFLISLNNFSYFATLLNSAIGDTSVLNSFGLISSYDGLENIILPGKNSLFS